MPGTVEPGDLAAFRLHQARAGAGDQVVQLTRGAQPLRPHLDRELLPCRVLRANATPKAVARLEERDRGPGVRQALGGREPSESSTDDDDVHAVVREGLVCDEVGVLGMAAEPHRHVPAARDDAIAFGPRVLDRGLHQPRGGAAPAVFRRNVGAVELEDIGAGRGVGEYGRAA